MADSRPTRRRRGDEEDPASPDAGPAPQPGLGAHPGQQQQPGLGAQAGQRQQQPGQGAQPGQQQQAGQQQPWLGATSGGTVAAAGAPQGASDSTWAGLPTPEQVAAMLQQRLQSESTGSSRMLPQPEGRPISFGPAADRMFTGEMAGGFLGAAANMNVGAAANMNGDFDRQSERFSLTGLPRRMTPDLLQGFWVGPGGLGFFSQLAPSQQQQQQQAGGQTANQGPSMPPPPPPPYQPPIIDTRMLGKLQGFDGSEGS